MEVTPIKIDLIKPNEWNPNIVQEPLMAKLRAEIGQKGLCEPIIVRSRDNGYEIVDGYHRWQICRDLGWQEIPCIVQDYSDAEAKIKLLQLNYLRGSAVPIKLASLIHDLNREIKLEDLAKRLPYEEPQMLDSLELLKLPENFGQSIEEQARKEEEELPSVISFVVYKQQAQVIEEALKIASDAMPEGAKNLKALALEKICVDFIEQQRVSRQQDKSKEADESQKLRGLNIWDTSQ